MQKPYAIIQLQGKQVIVRKDDELVVDRLDVPEGETVTITDVLLLADEKGVKVGTPTLPKTAVTLSVQKQQRGPKLVVATYKAKSRYRRRKGHRQAQTVLKVDSVK